MKKVTTLFLALGLTALLSANEHGKHWGYMGEVGPSHWGELDKKFNMCSEGKQQSPINVVASKKGELKPLELDYKADAKSVINNGHSIQVNIKDGSVFKIDGKDYKLKQFHFHVPSENNINGNAYPLEAHFVHATDDGKLAVIAVMFNYGDKNPTLDKIWSQFPNLKVGEVKDITLSVKDINTLMPEDKKYYYFMGSLTTPPCSESVKWFVLKKPLSVSREQINSFFSQFSFPNNRPIQPTNKRDILE